MYILVIVQTAPPPLPSTLRKGEGGWMNLFKNGCYGEDGKFLLEIRRKPGIGGGGGQWGGGGWVKSLYKLTEGC